MRPIINPNGNLSCDRRPRPVGDSNSVGGGEGGRVTVTDSGGAWWRGRQHPQLRVSLLFKDFLRGPIVLLEPWMRSDEAR
jgi:hypothetical protein